MISDTSLSAYERFSTSDYRPFRDLSDFRPDNRNYRRSYDDSGLLPLLVGMLIGSLAVAPFWIAFFEWALR